MYCNRQAQRKEPTSRAPDYCYHCDDMTITITVCAAGFGDVSRIVCHSQRGAAHSGQDATPSTRLTHEGSARLSGT